MAVWKELAATRGAAVARSLARRTLEFLSRFCGLCNVANARLRRVWAAHNADLEKALSRA